MTGGGGALQGRAFRVCAVLGSGFRVYHGPRDDMREPLFFLDHWKHVM